MFRFFSHATRSVAIGALVLVFGASSVLAVPANPVDKDVNADGLGFGLTDAFSFGGFLQDDTAVFMGNDILAQSQVAGGGAGAGISVPVSNGENGYTETFDTDLGLPDPPNNVSNPDIDNATSPNAAWATVGNVIPPANPFPPNPVTGSPNPRLGLNNGNVLRYSMWVREDPSNPVGLDAPQIEPVLKFEFWKEGLSTFQDSNGGLQPFFADKVFDTDQHLSEGIWIDINNDGVVADTLAAGDGRIRTITSSAWTLIDVEYEVDDLQWFGIDDDLYTVADIEEVRGVMFWGDFVTPAPALQGTVWFDNVLVEVFADQAEADANPVTSTNPSPTLDEVLEDADFDGDDDVTGSDFLIWQRGFGVGATQPEGDADFSGIINSADLAIWESQYGPGPLAAVSAVPEPSSTLLVLIGVLCFGGVKRSNR